MKFPEERFEYAKKLKAAISELQKVGEKLGKFEVEKRQAVENEDYDKAKLKKVQMDEYRLQVYKDLNLPDLLETSGVCVLYQINIRFYWVFFNSVFLIYVFFFSPHSQGIHRQLT